MGEHHLDVRPRSSGCGKNAQRRAQEHWSSPRIRPSKRLIKAHLASPRNTVQRAAGLALAPCTTWATTQRVLAQT